MVNGLSIYREPALHIIHHDTYACGTTDLTTEVGLSALAKLAFFAFCLVARNDMIPRLHISYSFTDTFHNSGSFVAKNARKKTLRILAAPGVVVGVAERSEEDLDADLAGLRRRHLHVLDHEWFVRLVRHRRFAGDDLALGGGSHCFLG